MSGVKREDNFDFSKHTTYRLGGRASFCLYPRTLIEAQSAYDFCVGRPENFEILGNGSNVLVSDSGTDGAVICTRRMQSIVNLGNNRLFCLAGVNVSQLIGYCRAKCLGGLEYLHGIPATVGGAVFMNAGVGGSCIGDSVSSVLVYDGERRKIKAEDCAFSYRDSLFRRERCLILGATLRVQPISVVEIDKKIAFYAQRRKQLPRGASCGCVFKNPVGLSSGKLIEDCGLKGFRLGGSFVSPLHANFIINVGASARDVKRLIDFIKETVYKKCGVLLEEEVVYIGEFNDFNG